MQELDSVLKESSLASSLDLLGLAVEEGRLGEAVQVQEHCTQHTAHCTLHTAHCTLPTTHCKLHTAHFKLHTAHCTLHYRV